MEPDSLRILIVEDDRNAASLFKMLLKKQFASRIEIADNCEKARKKLSSFSYDLITLDHQLPDGEGLDLLREITADGNHPPVVMVTGHGDERTAVEAFKTGVSGYVVKDNRLAVILPEAVRKALSEVALRKAELEIIRLAGEVKQQAGMLDEILSSSPDHIYMHDKAGRYMYVNRSAARSFGMKTTDIVGKTWEELGFSPHFMNAFDSRKEVVFNTGMPITGETYFVTVDGLRYYDYILAPVHDEHEKVKYVVSTFRDITDRKLAEEKTREQRDKANHYLNIAEVILLALDRSGKVTLVNRKGCELLGCAEEEIVGKNWFDNFVPERHREFSKSEFEKMMSPRYGMVEYYETKVLAVSGLERTIAWRNSLILDNQGKAAGTLSSGNDITEKKRAERSLYESEKTFRIAAETATDLIFKWDVSTDRLEWFGDIDGALGYAPGEFPRTVHALLDTIHPDDLSKVSNSLDRLVQNGETFIEEYRVRQQDGTYTYWVNRCRALTDERNIPVKVIGATLDITGRKKTEEELREANEALAAYAHIVSHDLKGPIASVLAGAELLEDFLENPSDSSAAGLMEVSRLMANNARKAHDLIGEILELAKSGQVPQDVSDIDIGEIVERILEERRIEINCKGIDVIVRNHLGTVKANATQIYQLFSNLVGNAVKFNNSSDPVIEIVRCDNGTNCLHEYLVKDNGPGIPREIIGEVLLPFRRGQGGGAGIGLSIAENIVKIYGGNMRVFNNGGANFQFSLNDYTRGYAEPF
ncbi:MAG: PAS domain S-box protein [Actinobacteria bacterium]|nr:PAS domain S-box protein [Actinomycetota bacterium]